MNPPCTVVAGASRNDSLGPDLEDAEPAPRGATDPLDRCPAPAPALVPADGPAVLPSVADASVCTASEVLEPSARASPAAELWTRLVSEGCSDSAVAVASSERVSGVREPRVFSGLFLSVIWGGDGLVIGV